MTHTPVLLLSTAQRGTVPTDCAPVPLSIIYKHGGTVPWQILHPSPLRGFKGFCMDIPGILYLLISLIITSNHVVIIFAPRINLKREQNLGRKGECFFLKYQVSINRGTSLLNQMLGQDKQNSCILLPMRTKLGSFLGASVVWSLAVS